MEEISNLVAEFKTIPVDHLFFFAMLAVLGLIGYFLYVHLSVVKSLTTKGKE